MAGPTFGGAVVVGPTGAGPRRGGMSPSPLSFGPTGVTGFAGVVVGGVVVAGGVVVVGGLN